MKEITVTVLRFGNKILLLKRRGNKHFDPGKWEFISGFLSGEGSLEDQTRGQVLKETGFSAKLIKKGNDFSMSDQYGDWFIHPFLFESDNDKVKVISADHETYEWIDGKSINSYDTVKGLGENLKALGL